MSEKRTTPNGSTKLRYRQSQRAIYMRKVRAARWELRTAARRLAKCPPEKLAWLKGKIDKATAVLCGHKLDGETQ